MRRAHISIVILHACDAVCFVSSVHLLSGGQLLSLFASMSFAMQQDEMLFFIHIIAHFKFQRASRVSSVGAQIENV
eukprot:scaffold9776_cov94-Skeletonema_dohrnii-CCMP3373.AAC.2